LNITKIRWHSEAVYEDSGYRPEERHMDASETEKRGYPSSFWQTKYEPIRPQEQQLPG
jgi:hypothetical protein